MLQRASGSRILDITYQDATVTGSVKTDQHTEMSKDLGTFPFHGTQMPYFLESYQSSPFSDAYEINLQALRSLQRLIQRKAVFLRVSRVTSDVTTEPCQKNKPKNGLKPINGVDVQKWAGRLVFEPSTIDMINSKLYFIVSVNLANCRLELGAFSALNRLVFIKELCLHDVMISMTCFFQDTETTAFRRLVSEQLHAIGLSDVPRDVWTLLAKCETLPFKAFLSMSTKDLVTDTFLANAGEAFSRRSTNLALHACVYGKGVTAYSREGNMLWNRFLGALSPNITALDVHCRLHRLPLGITNAFTDLRALTRLTLSGCAVLLQDGDLIRVARFTPNLAHLHLCRCGQELEEDFSSLHQYWSNLRSIALVRCTIGFASLYALALVNPRMQRVYLERCPEVDKKRLPPQESPLVLFCSRLPELTDLMVILCRVKCDHANVLSLLRSCSKLAYVRLEGREISGFADVGHLKFCEGVKNLRPGLVCRVHGELKQWRGSFNLVTIVRLHEGNADCEKVPKTNACFVCNDNVFHNSN